MALRWWWRRWWWWCLRWKPHWEHIYCRSSRKETYNMNTLPLWTDSHAKSFESKKFLNRESETKLPLLMDQCTHQIIRYPIGLNISNAKFCSYHNLGGGGQRRMRRQTYYRPTTRIYEGRNSGYTLIPRRSRRTRYLITDKTVHVVWCTRRCAFTRQACSSDRSRLRSAVHWWGWRTPRSWRHDPSDFRSCCRQSLSVFRPGQAPL